MDRPDWLCGLYLLNWPQRLQWLIGRVRLKRTGDGCGRARGVAGRWRRRYVGACWAGRGEVGNIRRPLGGLRTGRCSLVRIHSTLTIAHIAEGYHSFSGIGGCCAAGVTLDGQGVPGYLL